MSLSRSSLRPPAPISEEAIERYLAAIRTELDPDPLFRRRLRGHVVNRFVAAREGIATTRAAIPREMGRLGRAVLYASFALGISVTGVMAASQHAIPGDVFYSVKVEIESWRERVVPEQLRDDLAADVLAQRIHELQRLAAGGNSAVVLAQVAAVDAAYQELRALSPDPAALDAHLALSTALVERLPEGARASVRQVMSATPVVNPTTRDDSGEGPSSIGNGTGGRAADAGSPSGGNGTGNGFGGPPADAEPASDGSRSGRPPEDTGSPADGNGSGGSSGYRARPSQLSPAAGPSSDPSAHRREADTRVDRGPTKTPKAMPRP